MPPIRITLFAAILCSAAVRAEELPAVPPASLATDGMTPLAEGLYGHRDGGEEAYVAYTPAGHRALLRRLLELRTSDATSDQAPRTRAKILDRWIEQLGEARAGLDGHEDGYGDCTGPAAGGPFHVQAAASGGTVASARVENGGVPPVDTTNVAYAYATDPSGDGPENQSIAHGDTTAHASSSLPRPGPACRNQTAESYASATVTCPGATSPAITAIAISQVDPDLPCPR